MKTRAPAKIEVFSKHDSTCLNYHDNQILTAQGLREEHNYFFKKICQHNRAVFEIGVIKGLSITCKSHHVSISPGFCMDATGRIMELIETCYFDIPKNHGQWNVVMQTIETEANFEPTSFIDAEITGNYYLQEHIKIWLKNTHHADEASIESDEVILGIVCSND